MTADSAVVRQTLSMDGSFFLGIYACVFPWRSVVRPHYDLVSVALDRVKHVNYSFGM